MQPNGEPAVLFLVLFLVFMVLFFLVFRPPIPSVDRLLAFLGLLIVTGALAYLFITRVLDIDPDPTRLRIANLVTDNKLVDLTQVVPGLGEELDWIYRLDTDEVDDPDRPKQDRIPLEWVVLYRYDTTTGVDSVTGEAVPGHVRQAGGPIGAAIYDPGLCRPPTIRAFELVPLNYDYLGQDGATIAVDDIIDDPSGRPEVLINGLTRGTVTDLNIFRKTGTEPNCNEVADWYLPAPGATRDPNVPLIYPGQVNYNNIGSFRGNYLITRDGRTVNVYDRAGFERSQIVVRKQYRPDNGTYLRPGGQQLLAPVEVGLEFGPGWPDNIPEVYYPEKTVLAFYLSLTKDAGDLRRARSYMDPALAEERNVNTDQFGLALDRADVARVLVWEIRYVPNADQERLHRPTLVTVTVVGVDADGIVDVAHPCQVTWQLNARPNPAALPYGCEWQLYNFNSSCPAPEPSGSLPASLAGLGLN